MAPVNVDVKWWCVIVCAILLFERTVCAYRYDRKDLLHILHTVNCEYQPKLFPMICHATTHKHTQKGTFFTATQFIGVHANGVGVRVC